MADIPVSKSRGKKYIGGASPMVPAYIVGEDPIPLNPPGEVSSTLYKLLGDVTDTDFIGKNGRVPVVNDENVLTLEPLPQLQENGLISGGIVQWTGIGYIFNVSGAFYRIAGVYYESPPIQITLATPDVTNNRIDVFAVDISGVALAITGTPSGSPVKPQIDPQTQLELTSVIVTASTTIPVLTEEVIYDENTEWTGSSTGTGTVAFNSAADPFQGTVSIEATNIQNGLKIRLTDGSDYDLSTVQTLGLQINLKATMGAGINIGVTFLDSSANPISTEIILNHDKSLLGYQFVGIALSQFSFTSNLARSIEFRYIRTKGTIIYSGFFLDIIKLEGGINPPLGVGSFLGLSDTPSTYSGQAGKTVAVKADESGLEFVTGGGGGTFIGLSDTPANYTGSANKFPRVNGVPDALIFDTVSPYDLDQEGATDGQVLTWVAANSRFEPVTISSGSKWTDGTNANNTFIYRDGHVSVGLTTSNPIIPSGTDVSSTFAVKIKESPTPNPNAAGFVVLDSTEVPIFQINQDTSGRRISFATRQIYMGNVPVGTFLGLDRFLYRAYDTNVNNGQFIIQNPSGSVLFQINGQIRTLVTGYQFWVGGAAPSGYNGAAFKGASNTLGIFQLQNLAGTKVFEVFGNGNIGVYDSGNIAFGTVTGSKLGTATNQKLAFWNKTPIIQPTNAITASAFVANTSGTLNDTATFGGYTIGQIAAALINTGILA